MKILAILGLNEGRTSNDLAPLAKDEARAVWARMKTGEIRQSSYRRDKPGAVLEIDTWDITGALAVIASLPAYQAGVIRVDDLIPLAPYTGFETLFAAA